MCGRWDLHFSADELLDELDDMDDFAQSDRYRPSYNVAPTRYQPVVYRPDQSSKPRLECMKWGVNFPFVNQVLINARDDKLSSSTWAKMTNHRCVAIANAYYEWTTIRNERIPHLVHGSDDAKLLRFAGLFTERDNDLGEKIKCFVVITTSASSSLKFLHGRMPVILASDVAVETWLDGTQYKERHADLLKPLEHGLFCYPVSNFVSKVGNDSAACIEPRKADRQRDISKFFKPVPKSPHLPFESPQPASISIPTKRKSEGAPEASSAKKLCGNDSDAADWACSQCTFANPGVITSCEMCGGLKKLGKT